MTKKKNTVTLSLGELHAAENDWIDASHELPTYNPSSSAYSAAGHSSGGYSSGGRYGNNQHRNNEFSAANVDISRVPRDGPYVAYIGGLPRNIDEHFLADFFEREVQCNISNVNIVMDRDNERNKGYGYLTFADRESLIQALSMNGISLKSNSIKIDVADPSQTGSGREREKRPHFAGDDSNCWRNSGSGGATSNNNRSNFGGYNHDGHSSGRYGSGPPRQKYSSILDAPTNVPSSQRVLTQPINIEQPSFVPSSGKSNPFGGARPVTVNPDFEAAINNKNEKENEASAPAKRASIDPFGGARPVNVNPESVIAKLSSQVSSTHISEADSGADSGATAAAPAAPARRSVNPFGAAKPVDIKPDSSLISPITPGAETEQPKPVRKSDPFAGATAVQVVTDPEVIRKRANSISLAKSPVDAASQEMSSQESRSRRVSSTLPATGEPPGLTARPSAPRPNPFGEAKPKDTYKVYEETERLLKLKAEADEAEALKEAQNAAPISVLRRESAHSTSSGTKLPIVEDKASARPEGMVGDIVLQQPEPQPQHRRIDPFGGAKPTDTLKAYLLAEEYSQKQSAELMQKHPHSYHHTHSNNHSHSHSHHAHSHNKGGSAKPITESPIVSDVPMSQMLRKFDKSASVPKSAVPSCMVDSAQGEIDKVAEQQSTGEAVKNEERSATSFREHRPRGGRKRNDFTGRPKPVEAGDNVAPAAGVTGAQESQGAASAKPWTNRKTRQGPGSARTSRHDGNLNARHNGYQQQQQHQQQQRQTSAENNAERQANNHAQAPKVQKEEPVIDADGFKVVTSRKGKNASLKN